MSRHGDEALAGVENGVHPQPASHARPNESGAGSAPGSAVIRTSVWARIESHDLREFISNLRRAGCPEETIGDVVTFRVARKHYGRLLATKAAQAAMWQDLAHPAAPPTAGSGEDQLALQLEMDRELASLLGANPDELKAMASRGHDLDYLKPFLPLGKEMRVREIRELYRRLSAQARAELAGAAERDVRLKLQRLEQERDAEIAAMLTPDEREAFYLRHSKPAIHARGRLPAARDEAEFQKMVRAVDESRIYETQPLTVGIFARFGMLNPLEKRDTAAEEEQSRKQQLLHAKLQELLGQTRYAELFPPAGGHSPPGSDAPR